MATTHDDEAGLSVTLEKASKVSTSAVPQGFGPGGRAKISASGREAIMVDLSDAETPTATVFWHARVGLNALLKVLKKHHPPGRRMFAGLVFTGDERQELTPAETVDDLRAQIAKIRGEIRFVRLETFPNSPSEEGSRTNSDFMVWARVDLADFPPEALVPDYAGVSMQPSWFREVRSFVSDFIEKTHIDQLSSEIAEAAVRRALHLVATSS